MKKWDVFELEIMGKTVGNPFTDYEIFGEFIGGEEKKIVSGFYDGNGRYKIRFMPSFEGIYTYRIFGTFSERIHNGRFEVTAPGCHGKVRAHGMDLIYEDGTPYVSIGTTCYVWTTQREEIRKQTLDTLKSSAFNKIRFCIFPKHYDYNYRDPYAFPYEGIPVDNSGINKFTFDEYSALHENRHIKENKWDFSKFNIEYFKNLDKDLQELCDLGIEADIILFHPYDRWGFCNMPEWADELYLKYVTARYSAYHNVWWSLSNEYDLNPYRRIADWEKYAKIIMENDPYGHLRSIHNCMTFYDYTKPWVTHCSIQRQHGSQELECIPQWREIYRKPIVIDEMCYEGNIEQHWGNISPELMLQRMWKTAMYGGYPGHGECYDMENVWWSHGGILYGESYKRFGFLMDIMKKFKGSMIPTERLCARSKDNNVRIWYGAEHRPNYQIIDLGQEEWNIYVLDTWEMTIEERGVKTGICKIELPVKEGMAILIEKEN